jgi:dTDP-4-amino-4,6-dideoxygalactose transaminase
MNIPFMRVDRQFENLRKEILDVTESVFTHGKVLQGPEVEKLEQKLSSIFNMSHAVCVGSCTDALTLSLKALGLKPGGKVAVTSFSFVASASCIVHAGGIPVFVDIDDSYLTDRSDLLSLIKQNAVEGIIAVHLYGQMMDLDEIFFEAKKRGIFIIEDAAQCIGARRKGFMPGKLSDTTCVSFDPTKPIGAYGSGGAVLTDDKSLMQRIALLRNHGNTGNRLFAEIGFNSQMASIQAAIISIKLNYLDAWQKRRIEIADRYSQGLKNLESIKVPTVLPDNEHIFHKYVIRVKEKRDELSEHLKNKGVSASIHYSIPLHKQPCFKDYEVFQSHLPVVDKTVNEVLSLPIYPELTDDEVEYIIDSVKSFFS